MAVKIPFLSVIVGDYNLSPIPPEHIISFNYTRSAIDAANEFELEVFDYTAEELGRVINKEGWKHIRFQYGWRDGERSKVYTHRVLDYEADLESAGSYLHLTGTSEAGYSFMRKEDEHSKKAYKKEDGTPLLIHEIVEVIAEEEGWEIDEIAETEPVMDVSGDQKVFVRENLSPVQFIYELMEDAVCAETGRNDFGFSTENIDGVEYIRFMPPEYTEPKRDYVFEVFSRDSKVISFSPHFSGHLWAMMGVSKEVGTVTVDEYANEFINEEYEENYLREAGGSKTFSQVGYKTLLSMSSTTREEAQRRLAYVYQKNNFMMYEAELSVRGDPGLSMWDTVTVVPLVWDMQREKMQVHHSIGTYFVNTVEDYIEGGNFETTLGLVSDASRLGEENIEDREIFDD